MIGCLVWANGNDAKGAEVEGQAEEAEKEEGTVRASVLCVLMRGVREGRGTGRGGRV